MTKPKYTVRIARKSRPGKRYKKGERREYNYKDEHGADVSKTMTPAAYAFETSRIESARTALVVKAQKELVELQATTAKDEEERVERARMWEYIRAKELALETEEGQASYRAFLAANDGVDPNYARPTVAARAPTSGSKSQPTLQAFFGKHQGATS